MRQMVREISREFAPLNAECIFIAFTVRCVTITANVFRDKRIVSSVNRIDREIDFLKKEAWNLVKPRLVSLRVVLCASFHPCWENNMENLNFLFPATFVWK